MLEVEEGRPSQGTVWVSAILLGLSIPALWVMARLWLPDWLTQEIAAGYALFVVPVALAHLLGRVVLLLVWAARRLWLYCQSARCSRPATRLECPPPHQITCAR